MDEINTYQKSEENCQTIKPAIKTPLILMQSFFMALVIYIAFGGLIISVLLFIFSFLGEIGSIIGLIASFLMFFVILYVIYLFQKMALQKTEYKFYGNRVEYLEGFLVKNRKTINYDKITNIGQRKGILEGFFKLGTIFIDTAGSSVKGHELSITFLENPDRVYDWISNVTSKKSN